jgi:hypothetical protein
MAAARSWNSDSVSGSDVPMATSAPRSRRAEERLQPAGSEHAVGVRHRDEVVGGHADCEVPPAGDVRPGLLQQGHPVGSSQDIDRAVRRTAVADHDLIRRRV